MTMWAWARNGKPRRRLKGRSPAQAYQQAQPSEQDIAEAKAYLHELRRRYQAFQQTRARRADPARRALLQAALARLGIDDPKQRLEVALAGYCQEAIMRGLAIFEHKQRQQTLPKYVDPGPYLGGIIRNLDQHIELERTAERLLELRLQHIDLLLEPLSRRRDELEATLEPTQQLATFVEDALTATAAIDHRFYRRAASQVLARLPIKQALQSYHYLKTVIAASYATPKQRREDLIASLAHAASLAGV